VIPLEDDGTYEVIVVDAMEDPAESVIHIEVAITTGPRKGDVLRLNGHNLARNAVDLLGLPATVTVTSGVPSLQLD
jgi:hypothetical protein